MVKKIISIGSLLFICLSLYSERTQSGYVDFLCFSKDLRYAYFKTTDLSKEIFIKYGIFDTVKRKLLYEYKTGSELKKWNRYFISASKEKGIETHSYKGYSVKIASRYNAVNEAGARRLFNNEYTISLEYKNDNVYKRIRVLVLNVSSFERKAILNYRVYFSKSARAFALSLLFTNDVYAGYKTSQFFYALSW
jgi:hypothetical protein